MSIVCSAFLSESDVPLSSRSRDRSFVRLFFGPCSAQVLVRFLFVLGSFPCVPRLVRTRVDRKPRPGFFCLPSQHQLRLIHVLVCWCVCVSVSLDPIYVFSTTNPPHHALSLHPSQPLSSPTLSQTPPPTRPPSIPLSLSPTRPLSAPLLLSATLPILHRQTRSFWQTPSRSHARSGCFARLQGHPGNVLAEISR